MAGCNDILSAGILKDCVKKPVAGLEVDVLLFNREDVDYAALTYDAVNDTHLLTNFALKSGKTGYLVEGIKQSNGASWELVKKDYGNVYKHMLTGVVLNPSATNLKNLAALLDGRFSIAGSQLFCSFQIQAAIVFIVHQNFYEAALQIRFRIVRE